MKPTCPKCGSNDVHERNDALATYPVTELASGSAQPIAYGEPSIHSTEVSEVDPYICWDCHHDFDDFEHQLDVSLTLDKSTA